MPSDGNNGDVIAITTGYECVVNVVALPCGIRHGHGTERDVGEDV